MRLLAIALATVLCFAMAGAVSANEASPFIFDPDNLGGASAAWLDNMGCGPDSGGPKNQGLVMFKLGPTTDNKSSGAELKGYKNVSLCDAGAVLAYDFQPAGHCGAGAPRFNLTTKDGTFRFIGCAAATKSAGPGGCTTATTNVHDPNPAVVFPTAVPTGSAGDPACTIDSLAIVFDEGTDVGPGFAVIDNIVVDGKSPITKK